MNKETVYYDWYRDIRFKIHNQGKSAVGMGDSWTYYVYLLLDLIPDKKLGKSLWVKSSKIRKSNYIIWNYDNIDVYLHGGITFYAKHIYPPNKKVIEIGCDYSHLWDVERIYCLDDIIADAHKTIDDIYEKYQIKERINK